MNALQSVSKRFEPLKGGARNAHDYVNGGHVIMLSVQCQHLVSNADEISNGPSDFDLANVAECMRIVMYCIVMNLENSSFSRVKLCYNNDFVIIIVV